MRLVLLFLAIFLLDFCYGLQLSLDCPEEVNVDIEFYCDVSVEDGTGLYDVKFEIKEGEETVAKVFDNGEFKSSYYYLKEFLKDNEEKKATLIITKEGEFESILKVRQGSKIETSNFTIKAIELSIEEEQIIIEEDENDEVLEKREDKKDRRDIKRKESLEIKEIIPNKPQVISLNLNNSSSDEKPKKEGISPYFYYGIMILILISSGFYLWEKL